MDVRLSRRVRLALVAIAVQLALVVATALRPISPSLGAPVWHHNAALVVTLVAFLATWYKPTKTGPLLTNRAHLGIGVLWWTFLATVSGFLLLYLKQDLKGWELKDWAKWWHITWSWLALWYFIAHTAINWKPMVAALRRWSADVVPALFYLVPLALVLLAIPLTWSDWGARNIVDGNYIWLTLMTWLVFLLPTYVAWGIGKTMRPAWWSRKPLVGFVNAWLLPMAILANVTGFPILYFGTKDTSLKYVAKYWHTWPSIVFAILVFAHAVQWWLAMRKHWHTTGKALA